MGTTNLCYKELPSSNQPPLSPTIVSTGAAYSAHTGFCFPATFRELSVKLEFVLLHTSFHNFIFLDKSRFLLLAPSTCVIHAFLRFTANRVVWHYQQGLSSPQRQRIGLFSTGASITSTTRP